MHILLAILGAVGAAAFLIYRVYIAVQIGREVADKVGDPRRVVRKYLWSRKIRGHPLDMIDDPREAATLLMLAVARTEDEISDAGRAAIQAQMCRHFAMSGREAEVMFRQLMWMMREITDIGPRMRRLVTVLQRCCTPAEREDLVTMMDGVARTCGGLTPMRKQIIQQYRRILREQSDPAATA